MTPAGERAQLVGGVIVVLVVVATIAAFVRSPGRGPEPFDVVVVNDSPRTLRLSMCEFGDCGDARETITLPAGERMRVPSIDDGNLRPWRVADAKDRPVGCLPLVFSTPPQDPDLVIPVSAAVECGSDFGTSAVTGPDWPALD